MSLQNYSRGERQSQVQQTLLLRAARGQGDEITMYQAARALGMKPSGHVSQILAEMCAQGKLKCRMVTHRSGRWDTFYYSLPKGMSDAMKAFQRHITVKSKGVPVGQLELF